MGVDVERIPFGLRVFDFHHIVSVRFSAEIEAFSRPFSGSPANPRILIVRFSTAASIFAVPFYDVCYRNVITISIIEMLSLSQSKRNLLYVDVCVDWGLSLIHI